MTLRVSTRIMASLLFLLLLPGITGCSTISSPISSSTPAVISTVPPTITLTSTSTPVPPTPTLTPTADIIPVTLCPFHDLNADGSFNPELGESPIEGIMIRTNYGSTCVSGPEGCEVRVPRGPIRILTFNDPSGAYRWITLSLSKLFPISTGLRNIQIPENGRLMIPLRKTPGTSPICGAPFVLTYGFDYSPEIGIATNYLGQQCSGQRDCKHIFVYDNHDGLDLGGRPGTPVVAILPGEVILIREGGELNSWHVSIRYPGGEFIEGHLANPIVTDGQRVERYQPVGEIIDFSPIDSWPFASHTHIGFDGRHDPLLWMLEDGQLYCPDGPIRLLHYSPEMEGRYDMIMNGQWP